MQELEIPKKNTDDTHKNGFEYLSIHFVRYFDGKYTYYLKSKMMSENIA